MDLTDTIAPKSDQQNYEDYIAGPKTVTITEVRRGNAEQPVEIHLAEFPGRPYKPSKSMRRVLVAAWGKDSSVYTGRAMTLYGDPTVRFAGEQVGGIKISHLSHIDKPKKIALTVTRGKREPHTVKPLEDTPQQPAQAPAFTPAMVAASTDIDQLREWQQQEPRAHDAIEARIKQLAAAATGQTGPDLLDAADEGDGQ